MVYSLARFRHSQPAPPFELGGEFQSENGRGFIVDAHGRVEIEGDFAEAKAGDLITVRITQVTEDVFAADQMRIQVVSKRGDVGITKTKAFVFTEFVDQVRHFFLSRGLSEVFTPTLVTCPGLEPSLEPFRTEIARGREVRTVFLPTSPEIHLKKALTRGWTDIFELKTCFRKGEFSLHHESEFLMLEWYRGFADLALIKQDLKELVEHFGGGAVTEVNFAHLFSEILKFSLTPQTQRRELAELCRSEGLHFTSDDSFDDLFHRLLIDRIEPRMARMGPLIVRDFPPSQAALARMTDEGWADRFEFYWNGLEIANAFHEVIDPAEQRQRWEKEASERERLGTSQVPLDEALIRAMEKGMPPTGGIALGVERLFMALHGIQDIRELRLFSSNDLFV